jgi:hypothetical protein
MGLPGIYLICAGLFLLQMLPVIKYQLAERRLTKVVIE